MTNHRPSSHPSRRLLSAYASGWIPAAADLCIRVHLETCADCRAAVNQLEAAEADFVDALPDAPMAPETLAALIAKLKATLVEASQAPIRRRIGDVELPQALSRADILPRRWLRPGLWVAPIRFQSRNDWRAYLLRAPPGQRLPSHGHSGPELTCVLMGAFQDGRTRREGDFVESARLSRHRLAVTRERPCACLVATKGPLIWRGLARLLNPILSA